MEITERPPDAVRPAGERRARYIATQQWALEPWGGEDPLDLGRSWAIKVKFAVNGNPVVRRIQAQTACQRDLFLRLDVNPHDEFA
jgi:hypothetical protein